MTFEINYNIKPDGIVGPNLKDKKLMLKLYTGEKIILVIKKTEGIRA